MSEIEGIILASRLLHYARSDLIMRSKTPEDSAKFTNQYINDLAKSIEDYVIDKTERYEERLTTQKGIILNHVKQDRLHEQNVTKARIEELEIIITLSEHLHSQFALDIFNEGRRERIAELKKELIKENDD